MAYGPNFEVLYEFKSVNGADCRICTEDATKVGMMRGEFYDKKVGVWRQWLQSTEANVVYDAKLARDVAEAEKKAASDRAKGIMAERAAHAEAQAQIAALQAEVARLNSLLSGGSSPANS